MQRKSRSSVDGVEGERGREGPPAGVDDDEKFTLIAAKEDIVVHRNQIMVANLLKQFLGDAEG
jgi:hypothetical protein